MVINKVSVLFLSFRAAFWIFEDLDLIVDATLFSSFAGIFIVSCEKVLKNQNKEVMVINNFFIIRNLGYDEKFHRFHL